MGKPFGISNPFCTYRTAIFTLPKFSAVLTITVYSIASPTAYFLPFTVTLLGSVAEVEVDVVVVEAVDFAVEVVVEVFAEVVCAVAFVG